jgi:hypothetical protein
MLFQIVSSGMIDLAPLFYVSRAMEWSFLILIYGLLLAIPTLFKEPIGVDLLIILLLLRGPLTT